MWSPPSAPPDCTTWTAWWSRKKQRDSRSARVARADRRAKQIGQYRRLAYAGPDRPPNGVRAWGYYLLTAKKTTQRQSRRAGARTRSGLPFFAPLKDPAGARWTSLEKGTLVTRTLVARDLDAEAADFPFVAQAARLHRQTDKPSSEVVELLTSRPAAQLSPRQRLGANINHWSIENGLHARLDASRHDDTCRFRQPKAILIPGMFNRWANGAAEAMRMTYSSMASIEQAVLRRVAEALRPEILAREPDKLVFARLAPDVRAKSPRCIWPTKLRG